MKKLFLVFLVCFINSCAYFQRKPIITQTPPPIVENVASWDGFEQNSGLLGYVTGKGFELSEMTAHRYVYLSATYGPSLKPPLGDGEGLIVEEGEKTRFFLSPQYMSIFMEMARLQKEGK